MKVLRSIRAARAGWQGFGFLAAVLGLGAAQGICGDLIVSGRIAQWNASASPNAKSVQCLSFGGVVEAGRALIEAEGTFRVALRWDVGSSIGCFVVEGEHLLGVIRAKLPDGTLVKEWSPSALAGLVEIGEVVRPVANAPEFYDSVESLIEKPSQDVQRILARSGK